MSPPPPANMSGTRSGQIVEQVIRPTGLLDPLVQVRPVEGQIDDLHRRDQRPQLPGSERVLVTTLTKKMAEDLTDYLQGAGIRVRYMHSRHRHHRAHGDHPGPAPGRTSTCWWASTSCGRAWTCRRSPWSPSWTRTRRASSARETSLIQTIGRAARNAEGVVIHLCRQDHARPCRLPWRRRSAAEENFRTPTTRPTASSPRPSSNPSGTSSRSLTPPTARTASASRSSAAKEKAALIANLEKEMKEASTPPGVRVRRRPAGPDHRAARQRDRRLSNL